MLLKSFGVVMAAVALVAGGAREVAAQKDLKLLQGDWVMVSSEFNGKKTPEEIVKTFTRTVKDDGYSVSWEDEMGAHSLSGMLKLDPTQNPKHLDVVLKDGPSKGKTMLAIYKLEQDTQTLCVAAPGKTRPTTFDAKQGTLIVWKQVKK